MAKNTRLDFTTTQERKEWLKTTAEKQEISVSQLLNRLIRNRMLQEAKYKKSNEFTPVPEGGFYKAIPKATLSKAEILANIEEAHQNDKLDDEEDLPF